MTKRLISIPFFLLRTTTAGAALLTGLLQTYVFAHVLSPQRFSIFILVAAFGYSLWLIDFGIVKILFVRLRARFLAGDRSDAVAGHATAVTLFYFGLVEHRRPALLRVHGDADHGFNSRSGGIWIVLLVRRAQFGLVRAAQYFHRGRRIRAVRGARNRAPRRLFHRSCRGAVRIAVARHADRAQRAVGLGDRSLCQAPDRARRSAAVYPRLCRRSRAVLPRQQGPTHPQRHLWRRRTSIPATIPI